MLIMPTPSQGRVNRSILGAAAALALIMGGTQLVSSDATPAAGAAIHRLDGAWAYDFADDRYLVGAAEYVFFGRVTAAAPGPPLVPYETEPGEPAWFPRTMYVIELVEGLKAPLTPGTETTYVLVQAGGTGPDALPEFFEGDGPLAVGREYLIVARSGDESNVREEFCARLAHFASWACGDPVRTAQQGPCYDPGCIPEIRVMFLTAPGFDHHIVDDAADEAALRTRYETAIANQIANLLSGP